MCMQTYGLENIGKIPTHAFRWAQEKYRNNCAWAFKKLHCIYLISETLEYFVRGGSDDLDEWNCRLLASLGWPRNRPAVDARHTLGFCNGKTRGPPWLADQRRGGRWPESTEGGSTPDLVSARRRVGATIRMSESETELPEPWRSRR
jgi:hypothetical protein